MKITFIQTGGTIDKVYPAGRGVREFSIGYPAVGQILDKARLAPTLKCDILAITQKDSLDLTLEDRRMIKQACIGCPNDRIIITHGTDTMIETAAYLADIPQK